MKKTCLYRLTCTILFIAHFLPGFGQKFGNVAMGGGGYVTGVIVSPTTPGLMYCRTDVGGGYRWEQSENRWIPLNDWVSIADMGYMGVESMAIDPSDSNKVYMLLGTSYFSNGRTVIYRSDDKGKTYSIKEVTSLFKAHGNGDGRGTGEKLAVDPNDGKILFCGSRNNGLFRSADSGVSWAKVSSLNVSSTPDGNGISFVLFDPSSSAKGNPTPTLFVGVSNSSNNLYRSDDGGASFSVVAGAPAPLMPARATWASDTSLLILFSNGIGPYGTSSEPLDIGQVWKYKISDQSWTNITPKSFSRAFGGISVDPQNPQRIVISSTNTYQQQAGGWGDQIFITNDGGQNWRNLTSSNYRFDPNGVEYASGGMTIHWATCIEFDPFNTKRAFVVSGNGVFATDDIEAFPSVWKFFVNGLEETVPLAAVSIPGGPFLSVVGDQSGFRSTDPDKFAAKLIQGVWGSFQGIAYAGVSKNVVFASGTSSQLYYSIDTAKTFKKCVVVKGSDGKVAVSADGTTVLHCPGGSSITYRSADYGKNWTEVTGLNVKDAEPFADLTDTSFFYVYNPSGSKLLVSSDQGKTFFSSGILPSGGSKHIRPVPGYKGHIWAAMNGGGLYRSINHGAGFSKIPAVTSCTAVGLGKHFVEGAYPAIFIWGTVSGMEGLFFSTDEGASWNRLNDDEHQWGGPGNGQFVLGDFNRPGLAYMSSVGRGIVYARAGYMLGAEKLTIDTAESVQLLDTVLNDQAVSWTWSSNHENIATVNASGLVTGESYGTVLITATSGSGEKVCIIIRVAKEVESVSIDNPIDTLDINQQYQLIASITPTDATIQSILWNSSDPAVATVSTGGNLKGIKRGKVVITATADGKIASMSLLVGIPVSGLVLNHDSCTLNVNDTIRLIPQILPGNASEKTVKWSVDNPLIAKVDVKGVVKALKTGAAVVSATSTDGSFVATCHVTVRLSSIAGSLEENNLSLYPNPLPSGNELKIFLEPNDRVSEIEVLDVCGKVILKQAVNNGETLKMKLNLRPGLYLVRAVGEMSTVSKLLVR
ncbi:MAG: Ig-like domain-containing protein [Bacteroidales bacterium]